MQTFDVAVIGAGPAGASTAIALARRGHRVLVLERALFPRDKLCGDFINPINWPILDELNVGQELLARQHTEVRHFRITSACGAEAACLLPTGGSRQHALGVRRYHLDDVLMTRAKKDGATVLEQARVRQINKIPDGWIVEFERAGEQVSCRSRIIIGADGRNSLVARRVGAVGAEQQPAAAVGFAIQLNSSWAGADCIAIHQFPGGYAGTVQVDPQTVNLAFTVIRSFLPNSVSFATLRDGLSKNPFLRAALRDAEPAGPLRSVSPVYFPARRCFGDGFLLVGDAARVTEPLTGEGIFFALCSGQLAGAVINEALRRGDVSESRLSEYRNACRKEFRRRLRLNKLTRVLARYPFAFATLIRAAGKHAVVLDSVVRSVCGSR
jgi:geranylgeranyl reductase family protein